MEKMTKKVKFELIRGLVENANVAEKDMLVEFLDKEIERAGKKSNSLTKTQKANLELVEVVYDALAEAGEKVTVTDFYAAKGGEIEGLTSPQKVSALFKKLVDAGRIVRTQEGRKVYFGVATDEVADAE